MAKIGLMLIWTLGLLHLVFGYPDFQQSIPNGEIIPSPCNPNHVWQGVGHEAKGGGGDRNPFGLDFKANGYTWTKDLCEKDSDGDGFTNGEELGDPDCKWMTGATPQTSLGLHHPGICEPIDDDKCRGKNDFLDCETIEFACDALSDPDVFNHTVRLTESPVPAKETTYMCQVLDLPADKDYHLVAIEPYIDNINVMHHILVYGCTEEATITAENRQPNECFMNRQAGCEELLAIWAVGVSGICYHEDAGFKVGKTGFKKVLIEMHWNNPMLESTYTDASGMILHLTPNLRPYEAGMMLIGQYMLMIPPGQEKYVVNSSCSSDCTREKMHDSVYFVGAINHMHYLGAGAVMQMVTEDKQVHILASDEKYSYDSPVFYVLDEPMLMEPGNELQLTCHFKSTARSTTTFYGEGTSDEMCFGFLMYYPKENWHGGDCVSTGPIDSCEFNQPVVRGCDIGKYSDPNDAENVARYTALQENCQVGVCLEECKEVAREILKHPCFQWPLKYLFQGYMRDSDDQGTKLNLMDYWYRLDSCAAELAREKCDDDDWNGPDVSAAPGGPGVSFVVVVSLLFLSLL